MRDNLFFKLTTRATIAGLFLVMLLFLHRYSSFTDTEVSFMFRADGPVDNDSIRVYFDYGSGYNEEDTRSFDRTGMDGYSFVRLFLPGKQLRSLRLDPGSHEGDYYIKDFCFRGFRQKCFAAGEIIENCRVSEHVDKLERMDGETLLIRSTGSDPYLELDFDLSVIQSEISENNKGFFRLIILIGLAFLVFSIFPGKQPKTA